MSFAIHDNIKCENVQLLTTFFLLVTSKISISKKNVWMKWKIFTLMKRTFWETVLQRISVEPYDS